MVYNFGHLDFIILMLPAIYSFCTFQQRERESKTFKNSNLSLLLSGALQGADAVTHSHMLDVTVCLFSHEA